MSKPDGLFITQHKPLLRRPWVIAFVVLSSMVIVGASAAIFMAARPPITLSASTRASVTFTVIGPKKLPADTIVSLQPTYDAQKKIVITKLASSKSDIIISQQTKPNGVDLKQIDDQETFLTTVGTARILKGESGRIQAIIDMHDSWLFINAAETYELPTIKQLMLDLTPLSS
ncbi:MAG TPA: hypothetical protein VM581_02740 [Magnetospirillaceae bacterium]|nr:hypothetical protein [Magnetospirillaceae bacterium]